MTTPFISLQDVKSLLPIRDGNTSLDATLESHIRTASEQIQAHTRRQFDRASRVELHNTRDNARRVYDLGGTDSFNDQTFQTMGTRVAVREQIITLAALPVDEAETFEVRYDPFRQFGDDTVVDPEYYYLDAETGRLILGFSTARRWRSLQITYTAGVLATQRFTVDPTSQFDASNAGSFVTVSADGLTATVDGTDTRVGSVLTQHHQTANKYMMEFVVGSHGTRIGVAHTGIDLEQGPGEDANAVAFDCNNGQVYTNGAGTAYGSHVHIGGIVTVYLDLDNDAMWVNVNGTLQGGATLEEIAAGDAANAIDISSIGPGVFIVVGDASTSDNLSVTANFGASPFTQLVPSGFASGWGAGYVPGTATLSENLPDILKQAAVIQTIFLYKKLDPDNVAAKSDKKQGTSATDFLKSAGLTPEAASILTPYKKFLRGTG